MAETAWLSLFATLKLPLFLMIAGTLLVVTGSIGVLVSRRKAEEVDPSPDQPIDTPRPQMPPLPKLLLSSGKRSRSEGPPA
ncbi:hypothetical protein [Bradyrhizobium sp. BR 1432]|uniref:hypothetical protein n=1 Tax=Bradyrhizobium sp. BR 1432 TaxID=3447966 RepID=UPI003EE6C535